MEAVATADQKEELRAAIESEHNKARDDLEKQYIKDKNDLEDQFHEAIRNNTEARRSALRDAGLNPDGSDPQGRPRG